MTDPIHPQPAAPPKPPQPPVQSKRKSSLLQEAPRPSRDGGGGDGGGGGYHYRGLCSPEAALKAARAAAKASRRMELHSRIIDPEKEKAQAKFYPSEVELGAQLGRGGFSNVFEVERFIPTEDGLSERHTQNTEDGGALQRAARVFLTEHARREDTDEARYAVKFLRKEVMSDGRRYRIGAADLAVEAKFLSSIEHPNIIKMRGITADGVRAFATGLEGGYFIIMDRLYDTLETRIGNWKVESKKVKGLFKGVLKDRGGKKRMEMMASRLNVAFDICGALKYLHSKDIIYRDLKPENVGFDIRGDVKIFDFGLAKELQPHTQYDDGTYKLSGNTGSLRYMAPEVARSSPYNLTADVYSFGTMLWEMISLSKPYDGFNRYMHSEMVVHGGVRPSIPASWPADLRTLISMSWSDDLRDRPAMSGAYAVVRRLIVDMRKGDDTGLEHVRRRSTYVLQKGKNRSDRSDTLKQLHEQLSARHLQASGHSK